MKQDSRFKVFIIASLAAHILFFAALLIYSNLNPVEKKEAPVEISFIENENIKKAPEVAPRQIIETDSQAANEETDPNAKYLSEKNNKVAKETKAKNGEKFQNSKNRQAQLQKTQAAHPKTKPQLFTSGFDAYAALNKKQEAEQQAQNGQTASESSSTNDSLPDVEETLITKVNTREFKYYTYYTRIKNQLNQWWVPNVKQKFTQMMRKGRTIASEENKITKLIIVLNTTGTLVNVQVMSESGVRDLDDAAVEAFRSAAPFPNPPKGMIENDGTVRIRWDCVVES